MPQPMDWLIATEQLWYRIPVDKVPKIIKDGTTEYIAFYFPALFGLKKNGRFHIMPKITAVKVVSCNELSPLKNNTNPYKQRC